MKCGLERVHLRLQFGGLLLLSISRFPFGIIAGLFGVFEEFFEPYTDVVQSRVRAICAGGPHRFDW